MIASISNWTSQNPTMWQALSIPGSYYFKSRSCGTPASGAQEQVVCLSVCKKCLLKGQECCQPWLGAWWWDYLSPVVLFLWISITYLISIVEVMCQCILMVVRTIQRLAGHVWLRLLLLSSTLLRIATLFVVAYLFGLWTILEFSIKFSASLGNRAVSWDFAKGVSLSRFFCKSFSFEVGVGNRIVYFLILLFPQFCALPEACFG